MVPPRALSVPKWGPAPRARTCTARPDTDGTFNPTFHADLPISGAEESRMRKNGDWARLAALTAMPPPNLILRQDADAFLYVNGRRLGRGKAPKQPGQLPETD